MAKLFVREKKWPANVTYSAVLGLNSISITALLALFGKKNATSARVAKAFTTLSLPLGLASVSIVSGVTALIGAPIFALGIATVCGLPLLYKGTQLLFRKEIAQMQATQHLKEGQDK